MPPEWIRCTSTRFQIAFEIQIEYFSLFCRFHVFIYVFIYISYIYKSIYLYIIYSCMLCHAFRPLKYATRYGYCLALHTNQNWRIVNSKRGKVLGTKKSIETTKVFYRNAVKFLKCGFLIFSR